MENKKILIIGAGPVGCTVAEILSKKSFKVQIIESRNHIAELLITKINMVF